MTAPTTQKNKTAIAEALTSGAQIPMCNEYEKMISGMPFLPHTSPELQEAKLRTRKLLVKFNDPNIADNETLADIKAKRRDLARQILRHMGDTNIEAPFFVSYGCNITIGDYSYGNMGLKIFDSAPVTIGDYVWIAPDVSIHTDIHSLDPDERREKALLFAKPVTIKDDCWIGAGAQIMPGVTIERGCTIGAGAVVTKDIPEYSLAVGVLAKVIKSTKKNHSSSSAENHNDVTSKKVDQEWLKVKDREDDAYLASCSKINFETIEVYEGLHYFLTEFEEDGKKGLAWREGFERWRC